MEILIYMHALNLLPVAKEFKVLRQLPTAHLFALGCYANGGDIAGLYALAKRTRGNTQRGVLDLDDVCDAPLLLLNENIVCVCRGLQFWVLI